MEMLSSFVILFLDNVINKVPLTRDEIVRSVIGFVGVIFIIKPDIFSADSDEQIENTQQYAEGWKKYMLVFAFFIILTAWCYSCILCRSLKGLNTLTLNYPWGICCAMYATLSQIMMQSFQIPSLTDMIYIVIFAGLISFMDVFCFVRANQIGKAGRIAIMNNLNVVYAYVFEIWWLNEIPHVVSGMGSLVVLGCSAHLAWYG